MGVIKYFAKISRVIFYVVTALLACSYPVFGAVQEGANEEPSYKYIREFQSAFGRQIEAEFNLKWVEEGFVHNFSGGTIEFYADRRATLEEARALVLAVKSRLAAAICADPIMLSSLNKMSLTSDSICVNIRFVYLHEWSYRDGSIESVYSYYSNRGSKDVKKLYLKYSATDPFGDISDHDNTGFVYIQESFEDAVELNKATSITNPAIHELTGFENELNQILTSFKKEMKEEHGLYFQPSGWMRSGKSTPLLSEIRAKCTCYYRADCREARALMLLATEKLLNALNNSETIKPYLKDHHFLASQLKLRILFRKSKFFVGDVPYYDASMESVVLNDGAIMYYHHVLSTKNPGLHDRVLSTRESYQEAKMTFESAPPTLFDKINRYCNRLTYNLSKLFEYSILIFSVVLLFIILNPPSWFFVIPLIFIVIANIRHRFSQKKE